jgi:hypothetical protein
MKERFKRRDGELLESDEGVERRRHGEYVVLWEQDAQGLWEAVRYRKTTDDWVELP